MKLRIVDSFPDRDVRQPGDMWRGHETEDVPGRECWWVELPNTKPIEPGLPSWITWRTTDKASAPPHEMWTVSWPEGHPELMTVTPSIDVECWRVGADGQSFRDGSHWHGFITNGELTP